MQAEEFYDRFSADYDVMVDWASRLEREWPFFEREFARASGGGAAKVVDVGCATGRHAAYFARKGCQVVAADPSAAMLERARETAFGGDVTFVKAGFGELKANVPGEADVVTCLGNTLPHALDRATLYGALADMAAVLRPGGLLIAQLLNYDRVCATRQRFLGASPGRAGDEEFLFFRFYDFADPLVTFNVVTFRRKLSNEWSYQANATKLRPVKREELAELLGVIGFGPIEYWGDFNRRPFDPLESNDLIFVAEKSY